MHLLVLSFQRVNAVLYVVSQISTHLLYYYVSCTTMLLYIVPVATSNICSMYAYQLFGSISDHIENKFRLGYTYSILPRYHEGIVRLACSGQHIFMRKCKPCHIQHYHTALSYSTTIQHYHTALPYSTTIQHYHTALPYSTTIQHYHTVRYIV